MASRLLCRYARLLCRSSSQAPAACAASRLPSSVAGPAEVQRAKGWPWVTERLMCDRTTVALEDDPPPLPARTQLDELVAQAAVPEDILKAWTQYGGNGNQAANALMKWTQLVLKTQGRFRDQPPELMTDSRLRDMMNTISLQVRKRD